MALYNPIVVLGSYDGTIRALDARDGSQLWHYPTGHAIQGPAIAVQGDVVYAASLDGEVSALRLKDGLLLWQQEINLAPLSQVDWGHIRIAVDHENIAVCYSKTGGGSLIYVFNGHSSAGLWYYQSQTSAARTALIGAGNNAFYIRELQKQDSASRFVTKALRARDGGRLWSSSHVITSVHWGGASSPLVNDKVMYGYGYGASLLAMDVTDGTLRWEQKAAQDGPTGQVALGREDVYLVTSNRLGAYRMSDGRQLWETRTRHKGNYFESFEQIVFMDDAVYVGRSAFNPKGFGVEAWDPDKGTMRWAWPPERRQLNPNVSWRFVGANGRIYVPTKEGVYAISGSDGQQEWFVPIDIGFGPIVAGTL